MKYVQATGRCPLDKWKDAKALTDNDRAAMDAKVDTIEQISAVNLPPELLKKYKTTELYELKISGDKKKLRPLAIQEKGQVIILLCGAIEKGSKIPKGDLERAQNLADDYKRGIGYVKSYYED